MPIVELHILAGYGAPEKARLGRALTDAVRLVVPAAPEAITVMMHEMAPDAYMRGGVHRTPAPALPDPAALVRAYLAAMEARDPPAARAMLATDFVMIFPGGREMRGLEELIEWAAPRYRFVVKTYDGVEAFQGETAAVVFARGTLAGEWPDGTPFHGIRFIDRFEISGGLIARQEVWNDIAETRSMETPA